MASRHAGVAAVGGWSHPAMLSATRRMSSERAKLLIGPRGKRFESSRAALGAVAEAGTVRERMGHGSLAVMSGYMHRVSEADRAAAEYMGTLIDARTNTNREQK